MVQDPQRIDLSLEPLDDYVVIQPTDEEAETKTGLIIPASAEAVCQTGIVTAVGAEPGGSSRVTRCCSRRTPASRFGCTGAR